MILSFMLSMFLFGPPVLFASGGSVRGEITHRISGCDYFIVETGTGYDVLEWYGGYDPDKGDTLIGAYESYGFHDIRDETTNESVRIYTEDYSLSKADALEKLTEQCE